MSWKQIKCPEAFYSNFGRQKIYMHIPSNMSYEGKNVQVPLLHKAHAFRMVKLICPISHICLLVSNKIEPIITNIASKIQLGWLCKCSSICFTEVTAVYTSSEFGLHKVYCSCTIYITFPKRFSIRTFGTRSFSLTYLGTGMDFHSSLRGNMLLLCGNI